MAPSLNRKMDNFEYTHKKFNCSYAHKKLGLCFISRSGRENVNDQQQTQTKEDTEKPKIFKPYELTDEANKRCPQDNKITTKINFGPYYKETGKVLPFYSYKLQRIAEQAQVEYNFKLQQRRADSYIKNVMQFYENGNGWPSIHPNLINYSTFYHKL